MLELGKIIITICLNISLIRTLTVGNGIAPFRPPWRLADFTAGEELHLALKYFIDFKNTLIRRTMFAPTKCFFKIYNHYILFYKFVNSFVEFVEHGGVALFNCMNNAMVKMVF